jgi:hypothetical protein
MNLNPDPEETARLEALAYQAQDYALHMMRTTGSVPPTVIADTKDGYRSARRAHMRRPRQWRHSMRWVCWWSTAALIRR